MVAERSRAKLRAKLGAKLRVVTALIESLGYPGRQKPTANIRALAEFGPKAAAAIPHLQELQDNKDDGVG
jgi:hypothetical protein